MSARTEDQRAADAIGEARLASVQADKWVNVPRTVLRWAWSISRQCRLASKKPVLRWRWL